MAPMKVVILAGGQGTRLSEETGVRPKPLVEVGGKPIIWHVMKYYASYGFNEFVIALGYKGEAVKRYFLDYHALSSDLTVRLGTGDVTVHDGIKEDWTVHLVDTGERTESGGRMKRLMPWIGNETFMMTFCDGVSDVDLNELTAFHRGHRKLATVTAVRPPSRFGKLEMNGDITVTRFAEKPVDQESWINGAFYVLEPGVFDYIEGDATPWERGPLDKLALDGELAAFRHASFWQCMDTLHENRLLNRLWETGEAPWKIWR